MRIGVGLSVVILTGIFACFPAAPDVQAADPPPIEVYGMLTSIDEPALSPDGTMMAFISSAGGRRCLVVHHLDAKQEPALVCPGTFEVRWFGWKSNSRLVLSVYEAVNFPGQGLFSQSHLVGVNADGSGVKELVAPRLDYYVNFNPDTLLDFLWNDPDHILLTIYDSATDAPDVIKVDVNSGTRETLISGRGGMVWWLTDGNGEPRLAAKFVHRQGQLFYRSDNASDLTRVEGTDEIGGSYFKTLDFSDQPGVLYVQSNHETGRNCIYLYDFRNKKIVGLYASHPDFDIGGLIRHHGRIVGYSYADDVAHQVFTDPGWQHDAALIAKTMPDANTYLEDRTEDGRRALVRATVGSLPAKFYILTRTSGQRTVLDPVGAEVPYISDESVAPVRPVTYRSRDGLQIRAYLTLPKGAAKGPIPFVVLPHGGPNERDYLGYNFLAQMIASRGYGVLQPNFRGSTGYGSAFTEAGAQEWGRKMQDDITDGTKWLIDQSLADPARICIVGWSYGGYAALMGAIREPKLYKCAASIAGVTDLRLIQPLSRNNLVDVAVSKLEGGSSAIDENSPVRNADKISIPVLLVHGAQDLNVAIENSKEMEKALRRAGKSVDSLYFVADDHSIYREGDRIALLKRLQGFLKDNLNNPVN
jgi:dipeptidyl aminopeptidase/acylaminoacyl peptidase